MEKLTSKKVLELVKPKLCAEEVVEHVIATYNDEDSPMSIGDIEELTEAWTDMREWKRVEKRRLKDDVDDFIFIGDDWDEEDDEAYEALGLYAPPPKLNFAEDFVGHHNLNLLYKVCAAKQEKECWLRVFVPSHECLGNNFRLEVVTTPDDTAIVGWLVIVD